VTLCLALALNLARPFLETGEMKLKLLIVAFLSFLGAACEHTASDDYDQYDTSRIFDDIANNAQGGGN
jgi:hypothetical protein